MLTEYNIVTVLKELRKLLHYNDNIWIIRATSGQCFMRSLFLFEFVWIILIWLLSRFFEIHRPRGYNFPESSSLQCLRWPLVIANYDSARGCHCLKYCSTLLFNESLMRNDCVMNHCLKSVIKISSAWTSVFCSDLESRRTAESCSKFRDFKRSWEIIMHSCITVFKYSIIQLRFWQVPSCSCRIWQICILKPLNFGPVII